MFLVFVFATLLIVFASVTKWIHDSSDAYLLTSTKDIFISLRCETSQVTFLLVTLTIKKPRRSFIENGPESRVTALIVVKVRVEHVRRDLHTVDVFLLWIHQ
jgi:hypothetical protein